MAKKKYRRYSPEFKRHALKRASEDGVVNEVVIGGEGLYAGAAGTIHDTQFGHEQPAFPPLGGFIAGVIR